MTNFTFKPGQHVTVVSSDTGDKSFIGAALRVLGQDRNLISVVRLPHGERAPFIINTTGREFRTLSDEFIETLTGSAKTKSTD